MNAPWSRFVTPVTSRRQREYRVDTTTHDLSSSDDRGELAGRFRRGLRLSFVNTVLTRMANFSLGILLARLLAPDEFGLYAIALVVLNLLYVFCDFGGGAALIRHSGDVRSMLPTVWTFSLVGSALTYVACYLAAPLVAVGFGSPEATALIRVLSLNVILSGIGIVPAAVLMRQMLQGKRLIADLAGTALNLTLTGILAVAGLGPWSLVFGNCAGTLLVVVLLMIVTHEYPRLGWATRYVDEILRIGMAAAAGALLFVVLISVPQLVTGSLLGTTALGFYYLAFNVSSWPVQIVTATLQRVILPLFSRVRDLGRGMDDAAGAVIARVLAVCLPAVAALALLADPIVLVLYGSRWSTASAVLSALAIAAVVRILSEVIGDLLLAMGAAALSVVVNVVWLVASIPATILAGKMWGLAGIAWAQVVVAIAVSVPANVYALRRANLHLLSMARQIAPALIGTPGAIVGLVIIRIAVPSAWLELIIGATVAICGIAISWLMIIRKQGQRPGGWLGDGAEVSLDATPPRAEGDDVVALPDDVLAVRPGDDNQSLSSGYRLGPRPSGVVEPVGPTSPSSSSVRSPNSGP